MSKMIKVLSILLLAALLACVVAADPEEVVAAAPADTSAPPADSVAAPVDADAPVDTAAPAQQAAENAAAQGCGKSAPFLCWDQTCTTKVLDCPCPPAFPIRCPKHSFCVSDRSECNATQTAWTPSIYDPESANYVSDAAEHIACKPFSNGLEVSTTDCDDYAAADWLPRAYAHNAYCACRRFTSADRESTWPQKKVEDFRCIQRFMLNRIADKEYYDEKVHAALLRLERFGASGPANYVSYELHIQETFARQVYEDHLDAYKACCCDLQPTLPFSHRAILNARFPCDRVQASYETFGACRVYEEKPVEKKSSVSGEHLKNIGLDLPIADETDKAAAEPAVVKEDL